MAERNDLLRRAAECFLRANADDDAIECFVLLADDRRLGHALERRGDHAGAARAFERARDWNSAARFYLKAREPAHAGRCMLEAGKPLSAAWIFVHFARQPAAARHALAGFVPADETDRADVGLCEAGCDWLEGRAAVAVQTLRRTIRMIPTLSPGDTVVVRALQLSEDLGRPDLTALIHATCCRIQRPGAADAWRTWAARTFNDTMGIPRAALEPPA